MYRPNPDSLAARVIGFFALNPDEELSPEDVIEKFAEPGDLRNVHTQLMMALDFDLLAWDPSAGTYSKGSAELPSVRPEREKVEVAQIDLHAGARATPSRARAPRRSARTVPDIGAALTDATEAPPPSEMDAPRRYKRGPLSTYEIDVHTIPLDEGIPIPSKHLGNDWQALLARFKPGQSLLLPIALKTRLNGAAKDAKKAGRGTFTIRVQADGQHFRLWRVE